MAENPCPCYGKILAAFDGSEGSWSALRRALRLAADSCNEVTVMSVDEHTPRYARGVGEVQEEKSLVDAYISEMHAKVGETAKAMGVTVKTEVVTGHAAQSIINRATEGKFDLVVIGRSGKSGLWGELMGSTTSRVVQHVSCDVLVVS
jgi:nucleotide-binding universal stress UspA family protein